MERTGLNDKIISEQIIVKQRKSDFLCFYKVICQQGIIISSVEQGLYSVQNLKT